MISNVEKFTMFFAYKGLYICAMPQPPWANHSQNNFSHLFSNIQINLHSKRGKLLYEKILCVHIYSSQYYYIILHEKTVMNKKLCTTLRRLVTHYLGSLTLPLTILFLFLKWFIMQVWIYNLAQSIQSIFGWDISLYEFSLIIIIIIRNINIHKLLGLG